MTTSPTAAGDEHFARFPDGLPDDLLALNDLDLLAALEAMFGRLDDPWDAGELPLHVYPSAV